MKIFDNMLKKSAYMSTLVKFVGAINAALDNLVKLNEQMVKEINEQRKRTEAVIRLVELMMQRDPQLIQFLNKVAEKKKDTN